MTDGSYPAGTVRAAWIAALGTVLVAPVVIRLLTSPPAPLWTQLSTTTGLLALSAIVSAAVLPSRVRSLTRAFGIEGILEVHRTLGGLAAGLVLLHLACVVAADPLNVTLLTPARATSASVAATVATAAVALAVALAVTRSRTRHLPYELWRWTHVGLAGVAVVGSALHVWYLQQLVTDSVMSAVLALICVALLAVLLHRWLLRAVFDPSSEFVVREVRSEAPTVSTLVLDRRRARHGAGDEHDWTFAPGQFAWLRLARSTRAEEHPFTIASSAHDPYSVEFTIRHAGSFTAAVADLRPGQQVWVDGPHGAFTVDDSRSATGVVMIAGGVGVTPMMSMLRTAADRGDARRFHLVLVVAGREDVLFRDELALLADHLYLDVSEVLRGPHRNATTPLTTALAGIPDPRSLDWFVCGSPTLVATAFHALGLLGVPPDHVRTEQFDMV
ncbi:ferredoxin reductase family protein [Pseudonocardia abyssalis]|uniref:Ferric reductase-like transmembrane domain-containing protein n=1 Tax=Pseudonocardia abyssalis TaxID=2792008 RepID=A0ABS6UQN8_9PSEU|nr:ferric reductase-like transmembrane domain-containing protein [Pseudonocardia abyssalis]MBW0117968.1 ferric reductase-like transmembrane domain-containing protein [Pseudonocardia abyssalis]MBW0134583.1 ferric reductase-like transmembrane domain-containing protein [Pseudonocardia abyssalis]